MSSEWSKHVTVAINRRELDYIDEALEMLANYHDLKLADDISERLTTAWNNGSPLSPAEDVALKDSRRRKKGSTQ